MLLKKKKKLGKMLIEQIIEFDVRGHGPPLVVHVLLQLVIFKTKQKSLRNIFEYIILLFTSKILQEAMFLILLIWSKSLTKFKILNGI